MYLKFFCLVFLIGVCGHDLHAQGKPYHGPDDPAADPAAVLEGNMNGNRILLYFQNTTELSNWTSGHVGSQWSRWPNNSDGVSMLDGIAFMAAARVYLENDSIPVTDLNIIRNRSDLDTLFYLQTSYREEVDTDATGQIIWGFYPVASYFNLSQKAIAMSTRNFSWPAGGWPAEGSTLKWPGEWIGRFGRGKISADLESFFVVNDAQDQEYLGPEDAIRYYPRPNVKIGDIPPAPSVQTEKPWGGIGIRVEQRGYQWKEILARDILMWEYKISNISDYDLPEIIFGFWIDNGIGGDLADDELYVFNSDIDLTFAWDTNGIGYGGLATGLTGLALLETPSVDYDGNDNDQDGLVDEKRDNSPVQIVGATDGISDLSKFLDYYQLDADSLREHWDADEDQDWRDGKDMNNNGVYDEGEDPGDDVGLDGVAPADLNYNGPDEDEGNHQPDCVSGIGCEPNFNYTDVHEGDMLGLTTLKMMPLPSHSSSVHWFRNDRSMWELLDTGEIDTYSGDLSNPIIILASGPSILYKGRDAWISFAEIHSYDDLELLNSDDHQAPNLFEKKQTAQLIFNNDYRIGNLKYRPQRIYVPDAYPTIQQAITMSNPGDTILVRPGEYFENIAISQREVVLASLYLTTHNENYISNTILNGDSSGTVLSVSNCTKTIISGFTITNGKAMRGGGIRISESSPALRDLIIKDNRADDGAGIYTSSFTSDSTVWSNLRIIHNRAGKSGGGLYRDESIKQILKIENSLIAENVAVKGQGFFLACDWQSHIAITNSTITDNILAEYSNLSLVNCIVWPEILPFINTTSETATNLINLFFCDLKGGKSELDTLHNFTITFGNGNIDLDPGFVDAANMDYNLKPESPCIDAGTDSIVLYSSIDLANNERIWDGDGDQIPVIDMGAFEYGAAPVVQHRNKKDKIVDVFAFKQNYPNPFNPSTTIEFSLPKTEFVILTVFNVLGQQIVTLVSEKLNPGIHKYQWQADNLPSGIYYCRMQAGEFEQVRKMILLK